MIGDFSAESHSRVTFKVDTDGEILTVQIIFKILEKIFNLTLTGEYVQKWKRVFFDSALSQTRRSDASKKEKKITCPLLDMFACGQVSSPRLHRLISFYFQMVLTQF